MAKYLIVGEGMLELSQAGGACRLGYGGDTLNTAIHLARFGNDVAFGTALGTDTFSADLRAAWQGEGLDVSLNATDPKRIPGLYAIATDAAGERSFTYWRGESAARRMFELDDGAFAARAESVDLLLFSLISLAILPPAGREALFGLCRIVRAHGGRVAFDGNYRPALWSSPAEAAATRDAAIALADIGLPTLDDEVLLGAPHDPAEIAAHWAGLGCGEPIVKLGPDGCLIDGRIVPPPATLAPVDTSGAGDAFNAGFVNARLTGASAADAALAGHRLAGWVLMHAGAVPARTADAPY